MLGILGIVLSLALLIFLAYRGWNVIFIAPFCATVALLFNWGDAPLLATYTQTFMPALGNYFAKFFPLFLLGAVFGKLMDDSGSARAIAHRIVQLVGRERSILAVVLACAILTYGGVSLFVVAFSVYPIAVSLFRAADLPKRLIPAAIGLGSFTFTMTALPGTPAIQNAIPMPFFGTTPFAAPGLGLIASAIMLGFGLWWLGRAEARARKAGEGYGVMLDNAPDLVVDDERVREHATGAGEFDPIEIKRGRPSEQGPPILLAVLPLFVVIVVNLVMVKLVLPQLDAGFLAEERWGATSLAAVGGVWAVAVALLAAIITLVLVGWRHLSGLRQTMDAGANASVLPIFSVASLVGFGAVVAAVPAFELVRTWVLSIEGGPLVSLATATNVLAALTGSASGGLTIALDALGGTYMKIAAEAGISPDLLHRVAVIGAGTLDSLPHNGAIVTLLAVCGCTHRESYLDMFMVAIVGALLALVAVIGLGTLLGSF